MFYRFIFWLQNAFLQLKIPADVLLLWCFKLNVVKYKEKLKAIFGWLELKND